MRLDYIVALIGLLLLCGLIFKLFKRSSKSYLDKPLLYLDNTRKFAIRVRHLIENIAVFGAIGSGKTSAIDRTILMAEMFHGWGVLASAPKANAAEQIKVEWARPCSREKDVIIFGPGSGYCFPVLDWLVKRGGGHAVIKEAVDFLHELNQLSERGQMSNTGDGAVFFQRMEKRINHAAMTVDLGANGSISVQRCLDIIGSIPETAYAAKTEDSYCKHQCEQAMRNCSVEALEEVRRSALFLMGEMAALESRVKGNCTVSASVMWAQLGQFPLDELFANGEGKEIVTPEAILEEGAILCVDVPFGKGMDDAARVAFGIWKLCVQRLLIGRIGGDNLRPVVLFLQEGQNYLSTSDKIFVSQCREAVASFHYSSQSVASALSEVEKRHVDSILASLNLRVYAQGNCEATNEMASKDFDDRETWQISSSGTPDGGLFTRGLYRNVSHSASVVRKRIYPPEEFKYLQRGGGPDRLVETRVRVLMTDGMHGWKTFFDQMVTPKRRRSWLKRMFDKRNVVSIA